MKLKISNKTNQLSYYPFTATKCCNWLRFGKFDEGYIDFHINKLIIYRIYDET